MLVKVLHTVLRFKVNVFQNYRFKIFCKFFGLRFSIYNTTNLIRYPVLCNFINCSVKVLKHIPYPLMHS